MTQWIKLENRKRLIVIGLLTIVALAIGLFVYLQEKNIVTLTPEELVRYESVYKEYPVVFLRRALDAYVAHDSSGVCILQAAVSKIEGKEVGIEKITSGLDAFDKNYYKSKFIVATYNKNLENGNDIMIIFRDKPDRIFYAWVGRNPEGEICLLGFNSKNDTDQNSLKELIRTTKPSIYDNRYGI